VRNRAKLTQAQLAELIGTTQSVISRLEDADYEGHSLSMLQRIATALHTRLEIRFAAPLKKLAA
jgi:transcriptional regulator with XRE-family HTH domain